MGSESNADAIEGNGLSHDEVRFAPDYRAEAKRLGVEPAQLAADQQAASELAALRGAQARLDDRLLVLELRARGADVAQNATRADIEAAEMQKYLRSADRPAPHSAAAAPTVALAPASGPVGAFSVPDEE
jgi:hypothetical protein